MYQRGCPGWITSPFAADCAETERSPAPKSGAVTLPPTAFREYRRFNVPPTHRMPCPKATPPATKPCPWSTMLKAVGFSPLVVNTSVSAERLVVPLAESTAPPVPAELSHPRVGPLGGFPHGQLT